MDPGLLYIRWRTDGVDDARSDPPAGSEWWMSGALKVIDDSETGNPAAPHHDPIFGQAQFIRVAVDLLASAGTTMTNVGVQAWVRAFGTAGAPFLPSAGGQQGRLRTVNAQGNPFQITAPNQLLVDIPWTPATNDIPGVTDTGSNVHGCILANCFATPPGQVPDGQQVVAQPPPIDPATIRHHAQRNVTLVTPTRVRGLDFPMFAGNPEPEGEQLFTIEIGEQRFPVLAPLELEQLQAKPWIAADRGAFETPNGTGLAIVTDGDRLPIRLAQRPLREIQLALGEQSGTHLKATLEAGNPQQMRLRADLPEDDDNVVRVFDVVQRADDRVVGGARVLVLTVDGKVLEEPTYSTTD